MTPSQHLEYLAVEAQNLRRLVELADLNSRVATCPEWSCRNLIQHLGGIHRWVTRIVQEGRLQAWNPDLETLCGGWPKDADLAAWFDQGITAMIGCLWSADDGLECFAPLPAASPKAMWCRRQLHENTIHRIDLALAARAEASIDAPVADDGIDELLSAFTARRRSGLAGDEEEATYLVRAIDTNRIWAVQTRSNGVATRSIDEVSLHDDMISGSAAVIYRVLWNRGTAQELDDPGTGKFLSSWSRTLAVRYG